jgi:hypothetical protein
VQRISNRVRSVNTIRFLKMVLPFIRTVKPITDGNRCLLCDKAFDTFAALFGHITIRHRDLIEYYINQFYARLGVNK